MYPFCPGGRVDVGPQGSAIASWAALTSRETFAVFPPIAIPSGESESELAEKVTYGMPKRVSHIYELSYNWYQPAP